MSPAPPKVGAVWSRVPQPPRRRLEPPDGRRLLRFAPAAVLALIASQITYFICVSVVHSTGRVSGFAGWLAGAVVSYTVSRWAWERRGRPHLLRETLPFVAVSLSVGAILTEVSHRQRRHVRHQVPDFQLPDLRRAGHHRRGRLTSVVG